MGGVRETLEELAACDDARGPAAAALIEAGFAGSTRLDELRPGSVVRTLVEALARELAEVYEQLGETYDSAFIETGTGRSLEVLVDGLRPYRDEP